MTPHLILIMAQGQARRLPGKHFVPINDEPLLHRTLRLCLDRCSFTQITVVGWGTEPFTQLPARLYTQSDPGDGLLDGIWNTRSLWADYTTYLLGDVVFSRSALERCLEPKRLTFFGRQGPSKFTKCPYGEIFGISFDREGQETVAGLISDPEIRSHRGGKLWGLWDHAKEFAEWIEIGDWTDDIDTQADLEAMRALSSVIANDG